MRSAFLDEAEPEVISHAVRDVLERRGALISEHRHSRVRFHGLRPRAMSWARAGYVGIYQPQGESEAEVRLRLRARWPWRVLLAVCALNVVVTIATIFVNPAGTTWSVLAILTGLALVAAGLVYVGTLKSVREEERSIMEEFEAAFGALPEAEVASDEERELRVREAELEGELVRRRLERARAAQPKPRRFGLRPRDAVQPADADLEARRAELLARKAELEAKKREEP